MTPETEQHLRELLAEVKDANRALADSSACTEDRMHRRYRQSITRLRDEAVAALPALLDELEGLREECGIVGRLANNLLEINAELRADNERLREALTAIATGDQEYEFKWIASAALKDQPTAPAEQP